MDMTMIHISGKARYSDDYPDPSTCSYLSYNCTNCDKKFLLVDPDNEYRIGGGKVSIENTYGGNIYVGICQPCVFKRMNLQLKIIFKKLVIKSK